MKDKNEWEEVHKYLKKIRPYISLKTFADMYGIQYYRLNVILKKPYTKMQYEEFLILKKIKEDIQKIFCD